MPSQEVQAALFLLAQTGLLIWTISGMRADLRNLESWVKNVAATSDRTALRLAKIEGRLHIEPVGQED